MKLVTWNVNGVRAREAQLRELAERERPDVVCLQEIKATPAQIPALLFDPAGYWAYWHGASAYSGVALHVRRELAPARPAFAHPPFDHECRVVTVELGPLTVASIYVPNGGKDFPAKLRFLAALEAWTEAEHARGRQLLLCGDLNVARAEVDVHPKERKPGAIGQRPDERALFAELLGHGLVDTARRLHPDDDALFTWWAPWRSLRQRNIGWRIDYVLASEALAPRLTRCDSLREFGTSDHAPVVVELA
ncbi:exodeoxyribonuclease III [Anaeromyxobacter diazotrophicus]|uniref:Exodeoxyribonuclease III n=1 Tax=Anaeromyxobacter diazotrophicus TaxID=2590199 RepID=A0A7I9VTX5_9BACT|nr:exodeoxyribonuclease III [Anaeromyxobacter diazotrophicus]GEJ59417.1 exodeoxyribonuclease III [Anaeromyxobacter diazotrophicus]